jgi:hypothetical protein
MKKSKALSIIVFFLCFSTSCDTDKSSSKMASSYIGVFQIDLGKSELGVYEKDTTTFKTLNLTISSDGSFVFSIDVPFIRSQKGKWKIKSIDGIDFLYLVYGKGSYSEIEDEVNLTLEKSIFVRNTRPKVDSQNVQKLFFNRIKM